MALMTAACSGERDDAVPARPADSVPFVLYATIGSDGHASTRATITDVDDQWSYVNYFTTGDLMGFYSSGGNSLEGGKGFNNLKLEYDAGKKQFNNLTEGVEFSPSYMNGSNIFMYFPYADDIGGRGIELRREKDDNVKDENNESKRRNLRCEDFLSAYSIEMSGTVDGQEMALYGQFKHAFSELIIMRGEGFDNPPAGKWRITAVLNVSCTHLKVNVTDDPWSCTPQLVFYDDNLHGLSQDDAYGWNAWHGGNYGITTQDPEGKPAWYIIVPTLPGAQRSIVEYIELYDNDGHLQRVSSLQLYNNSKSVEPGWRYPMEITMTELVPTANPTNIAPWGEDVNLTDERKRGINDESEFAQWVRDYNAYLLSPDETKITNLLKYGDSSVDSDGNNRSWHFYVLSDLDMSKYKPYDEEDGGTADSQTCIIQQLKDILDGTSTTLANGKFLNHTIKGLSKTFIDSMEGNGSLQNFDFASPEVRSETSETPAGILVNTMNGTSVVNCNIDNGTMFHPDGPAGMIVGSINGGMVKGCTIDGFLVAGSMAEGNGKKIAGRAEGNPEFIDNHTSGTN